MLKTKDGYAKVIGTSYQGSSDYLLLSNGGQLGINTLVRAGSYEKGDLNNLDTYSFIKSVYSTVADHSPKGNTGWYNVIQAVHRNGSGDGPSYIGQIALGMTTNTNEMFFRTKYNGSWNTWDEVITTNTGLLRYSRNNININSPNCSPIPPSLLEWTIGYPRLYDPEFNDGDNTVYTYNNANNGVVTVTRVHDTNVGNSSSYVMKIVSAAGAIPNYGGWHVATQTELGKVYTCLFRASIPSGVEIEWNSNSIGTGGQMSWLTNNMGTGKWAWYAVQVYCGSEGSTTFFFSAKSPCTWYLSYVNVIENNKASYAGLRSVYSDYLKANTSIVFGRNELQYFNQYTNIIAGATNNANPKTDWYHILRMNHANNSGYFVDLAIPFNDNRIQFRRITSGSDNGWRRIITEEPNHNVILCDSSTVGNVGIGTSSPTQKLDVSGNIRATGQIVREGSNQTWVNGRLGALLRETSVSGYHTLWSLKTTDGSWDFGEFYHGNDWNNVPVLTYITDTDFNNGNNTSTYQIKFPLASGTIALTSNILNPSDYYWANIKISNSSSIDTSPTVSNLTAKVSIKVGYIDLISNDINSKYGICINRSTSGNISLCEGGGNVSIGGSYPLYKLHVDGQTYASGFRHSSHNSDDAVLLAGGGYSQGVIVKYWAIYQLYIGDSSSNYIKRSGNHDFITKVFWEETGRVILTIDFPSDYNKENTLIFGNGNYRTNSGFYNQTYVTITTHIGFGEDSNVSVMLSNGSSFNTGYASIYFMCMG